MCDVILQPAPGALRAPGTAPPSLCFNSLAPQHFTSTHCWIPSSRSHLHSFPQGGRATCWRERGKKAFSGNRDAECAVFIYGFSVRIALFSITPRIPFLSFSPSLSFYPHPFSILPSFSAAGVCVVALRFDGKNPEERQEPEEGDYERTDRSVTHFYLHPPKPSCCSGLLSSGNGEYRFTGGLQNLLIKDVAKYAGKIAIASAV